LHALCPASEDKRKRSCCKLSGGRAARTGDWTASLNSQNASACVFCSLQQLRRKERRRETPFGVGNTYAAWRNFARAGRRSKMEKKMKTRWLAGRFGKAGLVERTRASHVVRGNGVRRGKRWRVPLKSWLRAGWRGCLHGKAASDAALRDEALARRKRRKRLVDIRRAAAPLEVRRR